MFDRQSVPHSADTVAREFPDVGLFIDDERCVGAVSHPSRANPSLHVASLHSTTLYVHADGSASLGGTEDPDAAKFTGFVDAEDPRSGYQPGELVAMTLRCLFAEVAQSIGTEMGFLAAAATFPNTWTAEKVSALRSAMNWYGLEQVALVSESEALKAWSETTHATWAVSDSGIAAARGAATIASSYPVDAVTESIPVVQPIRPIWTRTPVLAAAAFAVLLTVVTAVTALVSQTYDEPVVPTIESAQAAPPRPPTVQPSGPITFPTAPPVAETVSVIPSNSQPSRAAARETTVETAAPSPSPLPERLPATRPAAKEIEKPTTTVDSAAPPASTEEPKTTPTTVTTPTASDDEGKVDADSTGDGITDSAPDIKSKPGPAAPEVP